MAEFKFTFYSKQDLGLGRKYSSEFIEKSNRE